MPDANADFVVSHRLITVEQGIASRDVKDAVMDTRGFMWLATNMGLNRYDGNNFLLFTKEKNGLISNDVQVIIPYGNNRLILQCFLRDNWAVDPEKNVNSFQVLDLNSYRLMQLKEAFPDLPFPEEQLLQIAEHGDSTLLFFVLRLMKYGVTHRGMHGNARLSFRSGMSNCQNNPCCLSSCST